MAEKRRALDVIVRENCGATASQIRSESLQMHRRMFGTARKSAPGARPAVVTDEQPIGLLPVSGRTCFDFDASAVGDVPAIHDSLAPSHRFELPASTQTLAEGLAEYFAAHPALKRKEHLVSAEARQFFRCHDIVHVLYGCGTSMPDEAIVKLASVFGTTGGLHVLRGYTHHETLDIYRRLPVWSTLVAIVISPYLLGRTIWRCSRQHRRWPWADNDEYMSRSLAELRSMFGIRVAHEDAW